MMSALRVVVDTNVLVSALLSRQSMPGLLVQIILDENLIIESESAIAELRAVLSRQKFSRILLQERRNEFVETLRLVAEFVSITSTIQRCRDPKDDKFLELAVDGNADLIITGDSDLLALNPFGRIRILTPRQFLEAHGGRRKIASA